jgi:protein tyrosine phosphatase (PTP) superfamily phosphohydrolase (DUF442 family)
LALGVLNQGSGMTVSRRLRRGLFCLLGISGLAGLYAVADTFLEDDNFRVVDASLYRSGQLRPDEWTESLNEQNYRSVLNLRGSNPGQSWYETELRFAADHGLRHYDYALSARVVPSDAEMQDIVEILRTAPKPLLVHCNSGSDRTGLVSALYVYSVKGATAAQAAQQLSVWFGHVPWMNRSAAMDQALAQFVAAHPLDLVTNAPVSRFAGRRWPT